MIQNQHRCLSMGESMRKCGTHSYVCQRREREMRVEDRGLVTRGNICEERLSVKMAQWIEVLYAALKT